MGSRINIAVKIEIPYTQLLSPSSQRVRDFNVEVSKIQLSIIQQ